MKRAPQDRATGSTRRLLPCAGLPHPPAVARGCGTPGLPVYQTCTPHTAGEACKRFRACNLGENRPGNTACETTKHNSHLTQQWQSITLRILNQERETESYSPIIHRTRRVRWQSDPASSPSVHWPAAVVSSRAAVSRSQHIVSLATPWSRGQARTQEVERTRGLVLNNS